MMGDDPKDFRFRIEYDPSEDYTMRYKLMTSFGDTWHTEGFYPWKWLARLALLELKHSIRKSGIKPVIVHEE